MRYFDLIRFGIPQSALAFIFIGRGSRILLQIGLYKNFQNKTKSTRITDWSDQSASKLPELTVVVEQCTQTRSPALEAESVPVHTGACVIGTSCP